MKRILTQFSLKKRVLMFVVVMVLGVSVLQGQPASYGDIGVGAGLSYGGLGTRLTYKPIEQLGLFGSLGYNFDALGYNVGAQVQVLSQKKLSAYLTGMYGYNGVLIVDAIGMKTKTTYFGFSTGVGAAFKLKEKSFLCAEILVPFRPQVFNDAVDDLKLIGYDIKEPLPIAICIGYHFKF
ncbi:hypothetical protein [Mangrovibacterium lignilyticum]|uniref:hypothetical protein n=1 Tax=Mangrovibacterium lignilyticum TaxID=2668052 RepID=UPI0013D0FC8E|nr:hypothetical protein [Mangrovibacterium lignilyticum]